MATITMASAPIHFSLRSASRRDRFRAPHDEGLDGHNTEIVSADAKKRICLKCRRRFLSTWAGHRLCETCRAENEGIGMPNGFAPPRHLWEEGKPRE